MSVLPAAAGIKRAGVILGVILVAALVLGSAGWVISQFFPRHDPAPAIAAGKDTVKARDTGEAIGAATSQQNRDSTVHVDITTKEIRDAFQSVPPAQPASGAEPAAAPLPAAPVDRLRNSLNAGIARANRAADAASAPQ